MAYFPIVGDLIEVRFVCYTPNQIGINVLHLRVSNPIPVGTGASLGELATYFVGNFSTQYKALMSSSAKWRGVGCRAIYPTKTVEYSDVSVDGAGTLVSDLLPTQATYVISKRSLLGGARNRGRIYIPFPPVVAVDPDGTMAAGFAAAVDILAAKFNTLIPVFGVTGATGDTDFVPVIKHGGGTTYIDIDHFLGEHKFATQRRRGEYGKSNVLPF